MGLGASAGGLDALQQLLGATPDKPNMAFVLVQHLDPNHESMMAQLLSRRTSLPVRQIVDGERIESNTIYVIPPNASLTIAKGVLHLSPFDSPRGLRRPIDDFFRSLAEDMNENAACVVLSGTGADGMMGLRAVKEHGGVTLAQDPDTARYEGMPLAAVSTGLVDFVLSPQDVIQTLENYFSTRGDLPALGEEDQVVDYILKICDALNSAVGHDFSQYKRSTLVRRVQRRMRVIGVSNPDKYLATLSGSADECQSLFRDLLINVTRFFRDREVFESLKSDILPKLLGEKTALDEVRIWVAGCSSGEEAYSIAMMVADELRNRAQRPTVQIFATDIDEHMLQIARSGRYPISMVSDIPPAYVERYTTPEEGHISMSPKVRDMVRFSSHNMIKDPPFSRLDLLSCRNVLIYMDNPLQDRVVPIFHYALKPHSVLLLGNSETIGRREDLFDPIDKTNRLYRRLPGPSGYKFHDSPYTRGERTPRLAPYRPSKPEADMDAAHGDSQLAQAAHTILERYAPAYVVVNSEGEVLSSSGKLSKYLEIPRGSASNRLIAMARPGLHEPVAQLLRQVREHGRRSAFKDIEVHSEFGVQTLDVVAEPVDNTKILVVFQDVDAFRSEVEADYRDPQTPDQKALDLEEELSQTRLRLRTAVEELETANEELRSSNEEMMSMNEELQSANEELTTVNEELKNKIDQLALTNDDLSNFINSTEIPMLIVDDKLCIRLFTESVRRLYTLTASDIGRPLGSFASTLRDEELIADVRRVAHGSAPIKREVMTDARERFTMRILPYNTVEGKLAGATITFHDITQLFTLEDQLVEESRRLQLALDTAGMGVVEYHPDTEELIADDAIANLLGLSPVQLQDVRAIVDTINWPASELSLDQIISELASEGSFRGDLRLRGQRERWVTVSMKAFRDGAGHIMRVVGVGVETTSEKTAEHEQQLLLREMNHRIKNLFATTSAIVYLTGEQAETVDEAITGARERIHALARAHDVGRGSFNSKPVSLGDIVRTVLQPYTTGNRIQLSGSEINISPQFNTPLGLILHEWATNSVKYGSLSLCSGRIEVTWRQEGANAILEWRETDGPEISQEVMNKGFGSVLLEQSVNQMHAHLNIQWPRGGMIASLRFNPEAG